MYYALGTAICLAVLFLVMAAAFTLCMAVPRLLRLMSNSTTPRTYANFLFGIRVMPLLLGLAATLGFALPAFLRFEPRSTGEPMALRLLALALLGGLALLAMAVRAVRIARATIIAQRQWRRNSRKISVPGVQLPVYCVQNSPSLLAVVGIFRARIFVAREIAEFLSAEELSAALAHEMAHVSAFDNFKQFLLKITRPPRWFAALHTADIAWTNASEIAADETALAEGASVLDLSAALVKVGRLGPHTAMNEAIAASHLLPLTAGSCMEVRVAHLQEVLEGKIQSGEGLSHRRKTSLTIIPLLLVISAYVICINGILPWTHELLELLVR